MVCDDCGTALVVIGFGIFALAAIGLYLLVSLWEKKYAIAKNSVRLEYLASTLRSHGKVDDVETYRCMVEYIALLKELGFKDDKIFSLVFKAQFGTEVQQ